MGKVQDYEEKMESELNKLQSQMRDEHPSEINFTWLWKNGDILKKYVTDLSIGANLESVEENQQAYQATFKKYVETMNLFYKISSGTELFKLV